MDKMLVLTTLFAFAGGFGLFIYGMHIMADGLQKSAGNKMKELLAVLTNNRFMGVIVGAIITAIIQSSSACTVMVVGFVNASLLSLTQAVGVIMGANIGTTITSWIVSSAEWMKFLKPSQLAPLAIAIGVMMMFFAKSDRKKQVGEIIAGFGILFIGLEMMGDQIKPYADSPVFKDIFIQLGHNPVLGILAGAAVTAIIQSSSASVGILQTLAAQGLVTWSSAVYIILGQNIGTCVTAILSSVGANKTAKRAAVIHLLFNVIGSVIFAIIAVAYFTVFNKFLQNAGVAIAGRIFEDASISMVQISVFHTIFNILNTILLFPFANWMVKLSQRIIPNVEEEEVVNTFSQLDERLLETPQFAIESAETEIQEMADLCLDNLQLCYATLKDYDQDKLQKVFEQEKLINEYETRITDYLVKISNQSLSERQNEVVTSLFHTINDVERIGDHADNMAELLFSYTEKNLHFSDAATNELINIMDISINTFKTAKETIAEYDEKNFRIVVQNEDIIDDLERELRQKHIYRLSQNLCDSTTGVIFLDIISNVERISDHSLNIVESVQMKNNK